MAEETTGGSASRVASDVGSGPYLQDEGEFHSAGREVLPSQLRRQVLPNPITCMYLGDPAPVRERGTGEDDAF